MVGDRPVDLVSFSEQHHYVPNCTADGLKPLFCSGKNSTLDCDPYFSRMMEVDDWQETGGPAIREEVYLCRS